MCCARFWKPRSGGHPRGVGTAGLGGNVTVDYEHGSDCGSTASGSSLRNCLIGLAISKPCRNGDTGSSLAAADVVRRSNLFLRPSNSFDGIAGFPVSPETAAAAGSPGSDPLPGIISPGDSRGHRTDALFALWSWFAPLLRRSRVLRRSLPPPCLSRKIPSERFRGSPPTDVRIIFRNRAGPDALSYVRRWRRD